MRKFIRFMFKYYAIILPIISVFLLATAVHSNDIYVCAGCIYLTAILQMVIIFEFILSYSSKKENEKDEDSVND